MTLLDSDKKSGTWLRLKEHIEDRIDVLRRKNDGDLSEIETARLRGCLVAYKEILMLGEDPPSMEADD